MSSVSNAPASPPLVERRRRPWLRRLWRLAFTLLFAAWSLLLLAWLILQWGILPRVGEWRPQIEARASAALGVPVTIGSIRVRSGGWMPALEIDEVVLHDAQRREALRLPRVHAALSARSLVGLELRFEQLLIDGPVLDIRRDAAGRVHVGGLQLRGDALDADTAAADWLFAQHEFVIRHGRLRWFDEQAPLGGEQPLELADVDFVVRNGLRSHELRLDATPPADWGERFSLRGRFTHGLLAPRGDWRRWSGEAHAWLPRARAEAVRDHLPLPFQLDEGEGALRLWVTWRDGVARAATADIALRDVRLAFADVSEPLRVAELQGRLRAERDSNRHGERLKLVAESLRFAGDGVDWPATQGALVLRRADGRSVGGELALDHLDLGALAALAARLPLGSAVRDLLARLQPSGVVSGLEANWEGSLDAPTHYRVKAAVRGLQVAAAQALEPGAIGRPGWRNAALDFEARDDGGQARLSLDKGALILPGVFEQPEIEFDAFSTRLSWRLAGDAARPGAAEVMLTDTRFANADAQGELTTAVWRTGPGQGFGAGGRWPGQLDLAGRLTRGRAAAVARYLPQGVPEPARRYVEQAVQDGRVASVNFKVRGDLWAFPFAPAASAPRTAGAGEFRIAARVEDVVLAYVPGGPGGDPPWPAFTKVSGDLVFDRSAMELRNVQARLWGVELSRVNGGIRDLARPVLRIDGQARGPLGDMLRFVNNTPVSGWMDQALAGATATGSGDLKLGLELPLDALERSTVQGALVLGGNDLRLRADAPLLANAKARVAFTHKGLTVTGGSARVLGGDAVFEGGTAADGALRFSGQGMVSAEALRRAPELGALARLAESASGQAPYRLQVSAARGRAEYALTSPLTGLALDLPAPLRKPAEATWPLRVETRLEADAARDNVRVELGNVASAVFQRDLAHGSPQVLRGAVGVGIAAPSLPERGVQAVLVLGALDVDAWQAVGERVASAGATPGLDAGYLPRSVALRAQSLTAGGRRLTQVVLGVSQDPSDGTWRGSVDAEQLAGYVEFRAPQGAASPGRVHARLSRLALPPSDASSVESLLAEAPAAVPALDIAVDDFELRGKKLGRLEIEAVNRIVEAAGRAPAQREWRLSRIALSNADGQLSGSGQWLPSSGNPRMVLDFRLDLADSGGMLARLGFPGTLRGGKGRLSGQLSWAGSPLALHVPSLDGHVVLALDEGQFLKAGPGAARLLGVLNLQALPRRLVLDFRDLFQEGFAFDNVTGDVSIDDGVASTNNLRMRGVQAAVLMEGSADIGRETQNLRVVVVPEINAGTASLAYAAINPALGLGTFLAQLLLRRPLAAASTREFTVQGPWADPRVERVERKPGEPMPEIDAPAASAPKGASR
ncbi:MAG TPA: YhdP family protein [Burkholderiaceae bacterium]|nr:YhdP family protein [Burkholderiaceae bacterium]